MPQTRYSDDHYRILRDSFETAMQEAGWKEIRDVWGSLYDWEHENKYRVDNRSAFDFWKMSGLTPVLR